MQADWNTDKVTEFFASAAADSSRWIAAMNVVAESTGSIGALLFPIQGRSPGIPFSPSMGESFEKYIEQGWIARDERYRGVPAISRRGVATEFDITTPEEMARHPYYQEFLAPFGLRWWAGVKVACGDEFWCLSIQRTIKQGPFSDEEQHRLSQMSKQLASAAALSRALSFARAEAAMTAFEATSTAVVLLDMRGEVLQVNQSANQLLGADLQIVHRQIVSFDRAATSALHRALHQLLWTRNGSALIPPLPLPRRGKRPLLAYPTRLTGVTGEPLAACQAILVLVDPDHRSYPPETLLRVAFNLTPAESRLAVALASGTTLDIAAEQLHVAKETARSQLKAVFAKTQTQRQAELVLMLAQLRGPSSPAERAPEANGRF